MTRRRSAFCPSVISAISMLVCFLFLLAVQTVILLRSQDVFERGRVWAAHGGVRLPLAKLRNPRDHDNQNERQEEPVLHFRAL